MLARTAFGPKGSAQPGPSATDPAPKASAERSTAPTFPGSPTPHRQTHSGPVGASAQRCRYTAATRDPLPSAETFASTDSSTSTPATQRASGAHPAAPAAASRSSPSAANSPVSRRARVRWRRRRSWSWGLWWEVIMKRRRAPTSI